MSQHTPGPWSIEENDIVAGEVHVICFGHDYDDSGHVGARWFVRDVVDPQHDAEVAANMRLIAAAPDLLAALEKIAGLRPLGPYHQGFRHEPMCGCDADQDDPLCQVGIARAAIRKATEG